MSSIPASPRKIWGRDVSKDTVQGYSCKVYSTRPSKLSDLLADAARWGERAFLVAGDTTDTYSSFIRQVEAATHILESNGIGAGDRVALLGFNRPGWLVAFWALQHVGAVSVLGNAFWNETELHSIFSPMSLKAAITDRDTDPDLGAHGPVIQISDFEGLAPNKNSKAKQPAEVTEDDPAIIMFSSGTTGAPKGVIMSHRSVIANIQNLLVLTGRLPDELDPKRPGTVSLLTVPLFHLSGIQISFSTMLSGGRVVLLRGKFDPTEVLRLIQDEKVRSWGSVPTMVSRVTDHPGLSDFDVSSLKSIPMGGSPIPDELRKKVARAFPQIKKSVGSLYGLTEAGGVLAAGSGTDIQSRPNCVGRLLPVVDVRIDQPDADGNGEILARTPSMTSGYWGVADKITDADGFLKTGDLGRLDNERFLYITGRSKDIIIRGGENIASQHVEQVLMQYPGVLECAVVPLPHSDLGEEVGAAVVIDSMAEFDKDAIAAFLQKHIARYEIPSRWWLRHTNLPVNATGKILKREIINSWQDVPECAANR